MRCKLELNNTKRVLTSHPKVNGPIKIFVHWMSMIILYKYVLIFLSIYFETRLMNVGAHGGPYVGPPRLEQADFTHQSL